MNLIRSFRPVNCSLIILLASVFANTSVYADDTETSGYLKIDGDGSTLAHCATTWSCVRDLKTGLIWEVKTNGGLQDKQSKYSWYDPSLSKDVQPAFPVLWAGVENGGTCTGSKCDTFNYVKAVNAIGLCGSSDWRMPTADELVSLTNQPDSVIDFSYFPNTAPTAYWTSSGKVDADKYIASWYAHMVQFQYAGAGLEGTGSIQDNSKEYAFPVRLVRPVEAVWGKALKQEPEQLDQALPDGSEPTEVLARLAPPDVRVAPPCPHGSRVTATTTSGSPEQSDGRENANTVPKIDGSGNALTGGTGGETFSGSMGKTDLKVTHKIHMPINGTLTVEISTGPNQNIEGFTLRDSDNKTSLGGGGRIGRDGVSKDFSFLRTGTYYLELRKDGRPSYYGAYTVKTRITGQAFANDSEPNDTFDTAGQISLGAAVTGHLGVRGQQKETDLLDYWKLTVPSDGVLELDVTTSENLFMGFEGGVYILGNDREYEVYWERQDSDSNKVHRKVNIGAGTYYILMRKDYRGSYWGSYQIRASLTPVPVENDKEVNDDYAHANKINSATITGHLGYYVGRDPGRYDGADWYQIMVPNLATVTFELTTSENLNLHGHFAVYADDGKKRLYSEYQGPSKTVKHSVKLQPGKYYLLVEKDGRNSYWGWYTLRISGANPETILTASGDYSDAIRAYLAKDYARAYALLLPLANAGDGRALYSLGLIYLHGQGITQDSRNAYALFQLAKARGSRRAQSYVDSISASIGREGVAIGNALAARYTPGSLPELLNTGTQAVAGGPSTSPTDNTALPAPDKYADAIKAYLAKDYNKAYSLLLPLANAGYGKALYSLALMYRNGQSVTQDFRIAYALFLLARDRGRQQARSYLDLLSASIGRDGVALGDAFAARYTPGNLSALLNIGIQIVAGDPSISLTDNMILPSASPDPNEFSDMPKLINADPDLAPWSIPIPTPAPGTVNDLGILKKLHHQLKKIYIRLTGVVNLDTTIWETRRPTTSSSSKRDLADGGTSNSDEFDVFSTVMINDRWVDFGWDKELCSDQKFSDLEWHGNVFSTKTEIEYWNHTKTYQDVPFHKGRSDPFSGHHCHIEIVGTVSEDGNYITLLKAIAVGIVNDYDGSRDDVPTQYAQTWWKNSITITNLPFAPRVYDVPGESGEYHASRPFREGKGFPEMVDRLGRDVYYGLVGEEEIALHGGTSSFQIYSIMHSKRTLYESKRPEGDESDTVYGDKVYGSKEEIQMYNRMLFPEDDGHEPAVSVHFTSD